MAAPSNNKPQQPFELHPTNVPPRPVASSQYDFDCMSPEQQAAMLHAWQNFWLKPTPAVEVRSGSRIVIPEPPAKMGDWEGKQPPTAEERESIKDWNKC